MKREELLAKLHDLGINTTNFYPKSSFIRNGLIVIGLYPSEMNTDFYFSNMYDGKIYKFPKPSDIESFETEIFQGKKKYMIPMDKCELVWQDVPYTEKEDIPYKEMSLRDYACIHLGIPESNNEWLNILIKKSNERAETKRSSKSFS